MQPLTFQAAGVPWTLADSWVVIFANINRYRPAAVVAKSAFCQSNSIPFGMSFGEDLPTIRECHVSSG
jgi:hypothetical protein